MVHEQPHRQGRPPERPADGRAARLRRPRPAHRAAGGGRTSRCCADNPYQIDVPAHARAASSSTGRSSSSSARAWCSTASRSPRSGTFLDEQGIDAVVMYDMAHVLGLVGPHFQEPFAEGADLVTGSTHKTFFGTQRGVIGGRWRGDEETLRPLGGRSSAATFPGSRQQPPPGHPAGPADGRLRDEPLQGRLPAGGDRATPRPSPGRSPTPGWTWPATRPSTSPRPTR